MHPSETSAEVMRANGFRWPLHPLQVVSWVVFGTDVLAYLILVLPMIENQLPKIGIAIVYLISVLVLVASTFKATACNPVDPYVLLDESKFNDEELDELPFCGLCNGRVQARSKHCRACNKCVASFDHHCMWLNNCIGGENYGAFFVSVSSVGVMIGIVLGTIAYQVIDFFTNEESFEVRLEESLILNGIAREAYFGILILLLFVNIPLWVLDMQLVLLHSFLMHQNLTTYEYIMNKRARDDESQAGDNGEQESQGKKPAFKALPKCMDWIVFAKCGRRRKKNMDKIQRIEKEGGQKSNDVDVESVDAGHLEPDRNSSPAASPPGYAASETGSGQAASSTGQAQQQQQYHRAAEFSSGQQSSSGQVGLHKQTTDQTAFEQHGHGAQPSSPAPVPPAGLEFLGDGGRSPGQSEPGREVMPVEQRSLQADNGLEPASPSQMPGLRMNCGCVEGGLPQCSTTTAPGPKL